MPGVLECVVQRWIYIYLYHEATAGEASSKASNFYRTMDLAVQKTIEALQIIVSEASTTDSRRISATIPDCNVLAS